MFSIKNLKIIGRKTAVILPGQQAGPQGPRLQYDVEDILHTSRVPSPKSKFFSPLIRSAWGE